MRKYSKAPWVLSIDKSFGIHKRNIRDADGFEVCTINPNTDLRSDYINSRLIECAPVMLELLKSILIEQQNHGDKADAELINSILKILNKLEESKS